MNEIDIYGAAHGLACANKQTVGDKHDYYITLEQLMSILLLHVQDNSQMSQSDLPDKK
jgi:hypothetical protein